MPLCLPYMVIDAWCVITSVSTYCKSSEKWHVLNNYCNCSENGKIKFGLFYNAVMYPKDADGMANREDTNQTAPVEIVLLPMKVGVVGWCIGAG